MDRRLWWIAGGLLALLGLAAPLASAQQAQTVNVEIAGVVTEVPDELPGVYEAGLEVTVEASGGHCACRQTTVDLQAREVPDTVDAVVFSPGSFVVDWTGDPWWYGQGYERLVQVNVGVSEVPEDTSMLALTVGADAESSNMLVDDEVQPTQLALPLPDDNATRTQAEESSTQASEDEDVSVAGTPTAASGEEAGEDGGLALGTGAATAGLALAGLTVHRFRGRA